MLRVLLLENTDPEELGMLPHFLDENDKRPAREQFHDNYQHGGGWSPIDGFTMTKDCKLSYPGDPLFEPIAMLLFNDELVLFYKYGLVAIKQRDGTFEVARMD